MPLKLDKIKIGKQYDGRLKISETKKELVKKLHKKGMAIRAISRMTKVSKRAVQFILFPERLERAKQLYKLRRKDGRYYTRKKHTEAMRKLRRKKRELYKLGKIK